MFFVNVVLQEDYGHLGARVSACQQYLHSLINSEMDMYGKGEWLALVRNRARDLGIEV